MSRRVAILMKGTPVYVAAYLVSGGLAYQLLTKQFYVGDHPIFAGFCAARPIPPNGRM